MCKVVDHYVAVIDSDYIYKIEEIKRFIVKIWGQLFLLSILHVSESKATLFFFFF